ncbi:Myosin family protein, partial (plasmid) [Borrelia miyamotoi FR64b]
ITNEDALLELKKELINLKNNNDNNLKNIENNLLSLEKVIDALNDKIEKNEELYKENKYKFQKKKDKINALDKRLANNENTILTLQEELEKYQNRNLLPRERTKLKHPKNEFYSNNAKITYENAVIKTADFTIYPDTHSNNYNFKNKSHEFDFKKSNGYYIEIEPTKNLYRAKEIYKLIPKYKVKNHFINPSLKNKETFFRNLIKVEHIDEIRTLYKNLTSKFKNIKIIK